MAAIGSHREYVPPKDWAGTDENPARVYLDSDHDARLAGAWRDADDPDDGVVRVAAYCVLSLMFVLAGVIVVAVAAQWR